MGTSCKYDLRDYTINIGVNIKYNTKQYIQLEIP